MSHTIKILSITPVTHDVRCIRLEKPTGYSFIPGQATDVTINREGWREQQRPFTFTGLNSDPYLEFTIKCYSDHDGVTRQISALAAGDELIIGEPWGAIRYQGEGYFIAGGAGITPFIAIFRQLHQVGLTGKSKLFFSNKTAADIIYKNELLKIFNDSVIFVLTREGGEHYEIDFIDKDFLKTHVNKLNHHFYVCGPESMVQRINGVLLELDAQPQSIIFEK